MKQILFRIIIENFIVIIVMSILVYKCLKKEKLIIQLQLSSVGDIILKIMVLIMLLFLFVVHIVPTWLDIPNCINKKFFYVEGIAQNNSYGKGGGRRVEILDEEKHQIVRVDFRSEYGIREGDELAVKYVPHSGYGVLLKINGKSINPDG